jgi:hypothetical protein
MGDNSDSRGADAVNIVVSMTTIPSRMGKMKPMIDSIRNQTRKPDWFVLWLPEKCEKEGTGYTIPDWLREDTRPTVMACSRDWGPVTKIIPLLSMAWAPDTLLVTVDDDVVYDSHLIEELEKASESGKFPDSALGFVGVRIPKGQYIHAEFVKKWESDGMTVDLIGGYRGVAYRRDILDETLEQDAEALLEEGPFVIDDHLVSWNLTRRSKKLVVVSTMYGTPQRMNFRFLGLGNGIYDEGDNRSMVNDSMRRIRKLYDDNGWSYAK